MVRRGRFLWFGLRRSCFVILFPGSGQKSARFACTFFLLFWTISIQFCRYNFPRSEKSPIRKSIPTLLSAQFPEIDTFSFAGNKTIVSRSWPTRSFNKNYSIEITQKIVPKFH